MRLSKSDAPGDVVVKRARQIAAGYRLLIERDLAGGYVGSCVELPTAFAHGDTIEECAAATQDAILGGVVALLELGRQPPERSKRSAQINIRVTPYERMLLQEAAGGAGQRVSEYVRTVAIERSRSVV